MVSIISRKKSVIEIEIVDCGNSGGPCFEFPKTVFIILWGCSMCADYADAKHRPHGIHTDEEPRNPITIGPESLQVTLDRWGPVENLFTSMYDALQANWGDSPSRRIASIPVYKADDRVPGEWNMSTGWAKLTPNERDYVESCFAGKTLQQVLEGVTFDFCIDGVSRAFTHQNVRTRLGAGFMQHGGRDNDWRHRPWTMPETMRRLCEAHAGNAHEAHSIYSDDGMKVCVTDWKPIDRYLEAQIIDSDSIQDAIEGHIMRGRQLYAALVDAGIPWQDARRVLFMGMQTYIHDQYNYLALSGVLANRLEHIMDWEFNCVAQLMLREIKMKCPPLISKYLGSHSDKAGMAKFAGLESWPPDRKYWSPFDDCALCGHASSNHVKPSDTRGLPDDEFVCQVCEREGPEPGVPAPMHRFVPHDRLTRQHRPEQMPFFVLHPNSMAGGPIVWIPTNGQYPHDKVK
jgi:thymidylate synthase ThyX